MLRKTPTPTLEHRYGPWLFSRLPSIVDYYIKNITETAIQGMMDPFLQETCEMPEELNIVRWNCTSGFRGTYAATYVSASSIQQCQNECVQRYGESSCDAIAFSTQNSKCIVYTRRANGLTDNAEPVADANFEFCSFYTETIVTDWLRTTIGTVFGDVGVERVWSNNQCDDPSRESQGKYFHTS